MTDFERDEKRRIIRQLARVDLGVKQCDLVMILRKDCGISISPSDFSAILRGVLNTPKANQVLTATEMILTKMAAAKNSA